jgi:Tfp pilus assembly protein PilN
MNAHLRVGIPSHWIRQLSNETEQFVTSSESTLFSPCVHESQTDFHARTLEKNCIGIFPDDAYLCTLPLHFGTHQQDSFIAIYKDENVIRIGITIQRTLSGVFSLPSLLHSQLNGFIDRIIRYYKIAAPEIEFPSTVYIFNKQEVTPGSAYVTHSIDLPVRVTSEIKALGVALCSSGCVVPSFSGPTQGSKYIGIRTSIYIVSLLLLLCTGAVTGYVYYQYFTNKNKLRQCEIEYKNILNNNSEIRELTQSGETLAKKLLRIETFAAHPTRWGQFLEFLGNVRPPKLFFERLGSEQSPDSRVIKIAIAGWADSETTVTDFIQKMNTSPFISNVTLSTLERDNKQNTTRFKILCSVQLSEN